VFRDAWCFVRRGENSSRRAHSAGVKRLVGVLRADGIGVKRLGGVLCADGVRYFTHQWGFTLLTPRGVPLSTPPSSPKHTRNRRVMLQGKFHRDRYMVEDDWCWLFSFLLFCLLHVVGFGHDGFSGGAYGAGKRWG
jgi:hypothetical protein